MLLNKEFTDELNKIYKKVLEGDITRLFKEGVLLEAKVKIPQEETIEVFEKYLGEGHEDITLTMEIGKDPINPFIIDAQYKGINIEPKFDYTKSNFKEYCEFKDMIFKKDVTFLEIVKKAIKQETHRPIINKED